MCQNHYNVEMDLDTNEGNCALGKRWRDSRILHHDADSATGSSSALFLIPKADHGRDGDENSVLSSNDPCRVDYCRRRRKRPRVDSYVSTSTPSGSHQLTTTTESNFQTDENKPPGVEWWRQRPARNDTSRHSTTIACFICTTPMVSQQPPRPPLKTNTLLNYFSTNSTSAASTSLTHQSHEPHRPLRYDHRQQLGTCTFCVRFVCRTCTRVCQDCGENFCTLCSMVDYRHADEESSYCLDCRALQMSTTDNPEQPQVDDDAMQLD